ncbi:MAG: S-layer protein, partial [Cyanobacteria bacterium J06648_11]
EGAALLHQALAYRQRVRSLAPPVAQLAPAQPQKPELLATRIQPESGIVQAGSELVIEARATEGARASATIAQRPIAMREVEPGLYRGSYRVTGSDAIVGPAIAIQIARDGESTRVQRQLPQLTLGRASTPPTAVAPPSPVSRPDATRPTLPEQSPRNELPPIREDGYPTFTAIRINPSRDLAAGDVFAVAIQGTPGGFAQFDLGSLALNIPMRETQPGLYEGTYNVASGDRADRPFVQVVMSKNGLGVRHRELFPFKIEGSPTLVSDPNPPAPRATPISRPLPQTSSEPLAGLGRQPKIYEAAFNGVNRELQADDVLRVTMRGDRGGRASFQIVGVTPDIAMPEISPGFYEGKVRIDRSTPVVTDGELQLTLELEGESTAIASNDPVNIRP